MGNMRNILHLGSALFFCCFLTTAFSFPQDKAATSHPKAPGFSAEIRGVQSGAPVTGQIYSIPDKLRMEQNAGGTKTVLILDQKQKVMWIINTSEKTYAELDLSAPGVTINMPFPDDTGKPCVPMNATSCTLVAHETVNDRQCDRWEVSAPNGEITVKNTIWIDPALGAPIQWKNETGDHFELTNIKSGKQLDSLFQVPAGFQRK